MALGTKIDSYDKTLSHLPSDQTIKKYQIMLQDIWNNLYEIGYYDSLEEALVDINNELEAYNTSVSLETLQTAEHNSPYGGGLDVILYENDDEEDGDVIQIRGFLHS